MKLFVWLFAMALFGVASFMLYGHFKYPLDVLEEGRVKAKSNHGDKIVSSPMRRVRKGWWEYWQVKVPGGGWYECRAGDCAETLRVEHVDQAFNHLEDGETGTPAPYQASDR